MPRFSVFIPAYKDRFLSAAIQSVLTQDYDDFELIIVNDASPFHIADIVKGFSDSRIRYYELKDNLGARDPSKCWNYGVGLAQGAYLVLLGDDDLIAANYLSAMDELIKRYPGKNLYRARLKTIDEEGALVSLGFPVPDLEGWDEFLYFRNTMHRMHSTAEMCLRLEALRRLGGYYSMPLAIGSDDLTYLRLAINGGIASTNATLASWRVHRRQLSTSRKHELGRIRAFARLGKEERVIIESSKDGTIARRLLVQDLPKAPDLVSYAYLRSLLATALGKLGIE